MGSEDSNIGNHTLQPNEIKDQIKIIIKEKH
jgi:hypothetical protein